MNQCKRRTSLSAFAVSGTASSSKLLRRIVYVTAITGEVMDGPVSDWTTDFSHMDEQYAENAHEIWDDLRGLEAGYRPASDLTAGPTLAHAVLDALHLVPVPVASFRLVEAG